MTICAGTTTDLQPLFPAEGTDDSDEARRRVRWEIFSALTEVVSGQGDWSEQSAALIRGEGLAWARAGGSFDELLAMVRTMTRSLINRSTLGGQDQDALRYEIMLLRLGDAGRRVGRELSFGFFEDESTREGTVPSPRRAPTGSAPERSADSHAVLAVRAPSCTLADVDRAFRGHADAMVLVSDEGANVLLPAADQGESVALARKAHGDLPGDVWITVHWQHSCLGEPGVSAVLDKGGLSAADDICTALLALDFPPGVYELDDVLVEVGAAETPAVTERLVKLVEPLHEHPVLLDTLTALIAADGVRHHACERLGIHRNTLDRRLHRIGRLSDQRPDSLRGLCTLLCTLRGARRGRLDRAAA
jgi:hypothetical protein